MTGTITKEWTRDAVYSNFLILFPAGECLTFETLVDRVFDWVKETFGDSDELFFEFLFDRPEGVAVDDPSILNQILHDASFWNLVSFEMDAYVGEGFCFQYVTFDIVDQEPFLAMVREGMAKVLADPANEGLHWDDLLYELDYTQFVMFNWDAFKDIRITNIQVKEKI